MNRTLKIMRAAALVAMFAAVVAGSALANPMQAKEGDAAPGQKNLSRLADHIEILRILVTKSINEGPFSERYSEAMKKANEEAKKQLAAQLADEKAAAGADSRLWRLYSELGGAGSSFAWRDGSPTFTSHTRGFYAEGVGVLFTTEVSTPGRLVEIQPAKAEEQAPTTEDDEWLAAAQEAQGRSNQLVQELMLRKNERSAKAWEIDSAYVEDAINGVIDAVARHGGRLTDLPAGENIIVAMRFEGDESGSYSLPLAVAATAEMKRAAEVEMAAAAAAARSQPDMPDPVSAPSLPSAPMAYTMWSGDWGTPWRARTEHVVIQIPRSALQGGATAEQVRQRATITRYAGGGEEGDWDVFAPLAR